MLHTSVTMASHLVSNGTIPERKNLYLVGINVTHTIAPPMHDHISQSVLQLPWTFTPVECPDVTDAVKLFHQPAFAGGVVTMPYKKAIMPYLDSIDDLCKRIGACNGVYLTPDGKLRGTNTDWRGIKGCLEAADPESTGAGRAACIVGAGGASRAAVYALGVEIGCRRIYVVNRDEQEVRDLVADVAKMDGEREVEIVHITAPEQVERLEEEERPFYIVGTVPDFEPSTPEEVRAKNIFQAFLAAPDDRNKGVFLDMCFKPRVTRQIKLAKQYGWVTVEGTGIIGHQIEEQWRLWTGRTLTKDEQEEAWRVLRDAAEKSGAINF